MLYPETITNNTFFLILNSKQCTEEVVAFALQYQILKLTKALKAEEGNDNFVTLTERKKKKVSEKQGK